VDAHRDRGGGILERDVADRLAADLDLAALEGLAVDPGIVDLVERDVQRVSPVDVRPLGVVPEPFPDLVGGLIGLESIQGQFPVMKPVGIHLRLIHILVPAHDRVGVD